MMQITEVLMECTPDRVNFNAFLECLNRAKQNRNTMKGRTREELKGEEVILVKKILMDINKYLKVDNLSFDDIFMKKDHKKNATIKIADLHKALTEELYVDDSPALNLLYDYFRKENDYIDLIEFKKELYEQDKTVRRVMNLDNFLRELKSKFNFDVIALLKFFDYNNNKRISMSEFVNGCKRLMNLDKEMSQFFFREMDEDNNGVLTTVELKDFLNKEINRKKELVHKVHEFVFNHKNYLLQCFRRLDREG